MNDAQDVYEGLAAHLDRLPAGFPRTPSGVEIRILKRLFTPEEAELAQLLIFKPESVQQIAERAGRDPQILARELEKMSYKGLIFRLGRSPKVRYMASQFMVGIWEYHVNDLTPDLIKDVDAYFPYLLTGAYQPGLEQVRIIPVPGALSPDQRPTGYEDARSILDEQEKILVAPCICRRERQLVGEGCNRLPESCLVFGAGADYYEENGLGRVIDRQEADKILAAAEEAGLVFSPSNAQNATNICLCCGCCCQILKNLKRMAKPAECVATNYFAFLEEDVCIGCEICMDRCQMDAIGMAEGHAVIDRDRCIGCGLCVTTCTSQAIRLERKEETACQEPPVRLTETFQHIARKRLK